MNDRGSLGRVALFGAGGAIGRALAAALSANASGFRVVGRNPDRLRAAFPQAEARAADFLSGEGADRAAADVDTVFYLAGTDYTHFERHPVMIANALSAAKGAGVRRFVHVAPVYGYSPSRGKRVAENDPHAPVTRKGRWRLEQEQAVLGADDATGMRTLVVFLPDFYGPHADNSYANYFLRDAVAGKTATWIGPLNALREFVYVPDTGPPMLALAALDDAYGTRWNLGGSTIVADEFVRQAFDVLGTPRKMRAATKLMLQGLGVFDPMMREIAEMYYLSEGDVILDDSKLSSRLGGLTKTPFDRGIPATIGWMKTAEAAPP